MSFYDISWQVDYDIYVSYYTNMGIKRTDLISRNAKKTFKIEILDIFTLEMGDNWIFDILLRIFHKILCKFKLLWAGWILNLWLKVRYFWAMCIWTTLLRGVLSWYDHFWFFWHTLRVGGWWGWRVQNPWIGKSQDPR